MPLTQPNDRGCGCIGRCGPNGHGIRRAGTVPPTGIGAPRAALLLGLAKLRGGALRVYFSLGSRCPQRQLQRRRPWQGALAAAQRAVCGSCAAAAALSTIATSRWP
eukprot:Transcript_23593.p4 GENE.Transcript_23593~~Transcript_23593.p4  ORF type:complete len:106 (+),score=3.97 Transcript_23593:143-460(+)